jgi:Na+-driven multidrug efflux pump
MENEAQQPVRGKRYLVRLKVLALAVPIILASCVFSGDNNVSTSVVIRYDGNGVTVVINLNQPVRLLLGKDDAAFIMEQSACGCEGPLTLFC